MLKNTNIKVCDYGIEVDVLNINIRVLDSKKNYSPIKTKVDLP